MPQNLEIKVNTILEENLDFVVSRTANFIEGQQDELISIKKFDRNSNNQINLLNFINGRLYRLTYDFFVHRNCLQSISFSENIKSGQETNFFIKFLSLELIGQSF